MANQKVGSLTTKSDVTLLDEVQTLIRREKEIVCEVIEYLKEIENRKLHLARGFSSLFAFAIEFLGYSEAEAHVRIQAARLTQSLPDGKTLIESGELSLSVAASAQSHFRKENLRRKEGGKPVLNLQEKREALELVSGASRREAEQNLNIHFAQQSKRSFSFQAGSELTVKIDRLMNFMAHKNFDRDLGKMVELLVDAELARYEKKLGSEQPQVQEQKLDIEDQLDSAQKLNSNPTVEAPQAIHKSKPLRSSQKRQVSSRRSRYIPQKVRALVWAKSQGRCRFKDPITSRICESRHGVEIDHLHPFTRGGGSDVQNLTLLCASHNKWKAARVLSDQSFAMDLG